MYLSVYNIDYFTSGTIKHCQIPNFDTNPLFMFVLLYSKKNCYSLRCLKHQIPSVNKGISYYAIVIYLRLNNSGKINHGRQRGYSPQQKWFEHPAAPSQLNIKTPHFPCYQTNMSRIPPLATFFFQVPLIGGGFLQCKCFYRKDKS